MLKGRHFGGCKNGGFYLAPLFLTGTRMEPSAQSCTYNVQIRIKINFDLRQGVKAVEIGRVNVK